MQTTTLPIQVSNAALDAAQRPQQQQAIGDAGKFSANLSREMAARQNAAPAAVAPVQKPKAADKPAAVSPQPAAREASQAKAVADDKTAKAEGSAEKVAADEAEAAEAAASTPMADMLALVASFNQLQDAAAAAPATPLPAAPADQLAALQAAFKSLGADTVEAPLPGAALPVADVTDGASAALPQAGLTAGDKAEAQQGAGFHAAQDAASAAAAAKASPEAAGLTPRQAREALETATLQDAAPVAPTVLQAQPAALEVAQAAAGAATDKLAARVGTQAWNQQVSQKIVWMVAGEEQTASLTLNPPELGPMQVVLSVSNEQTSVAFSSNQLEVRQALENALPRLREMMSESGIALGNATVDAGMPDGREPQQQARGERVAGRSRAGGASGEADAGAIPAPRSRPIGDRGMVDTFA